jgi:putative photosynthetic complex assembly protein 2
MTQYVYPALYALFVWWFSTGVIIYLDGLPRRTFRWSMLGATVVLLVSIWGLARSSLDTTIGGAYAAFTYGLLAWGWQEISFYMGFVTGSRRAPCPEGCRGWRHFGHAVQTSLYHELAIIVCALVVVAVSRGAPNQIGTWTFMVLWWMHQSAKLNVFLGVRNLNEEFLPEHLQFLKSFLTKKPMNLLFPASVTLSTVIAALLFRRAFAADATGFAATGFTFLGMMMALAILEHWFLVLPLPAAALWRWGLRSRGARQPFDVEVVAGFLGAGKTTFLRRRLDEGAANLRTVVLVNDFSAIGIDGSLLSRRGADIVELPNGCICCSLRQDLAAQLQVVVARWAPQRVLIEPSGVADVAALLGVLEHAELKPLVRSLRVCVVVDAAAFLGDYARRPEYFVAQARLAPVFIVNKTDLVAPAEYTVVETTLRALNPRAAIFPASWGAVENAALAKASLTRLQAAVEEPDAGAANRHDHETDALGLTSWSTLLKYPCNPESLRAVLDAVARGAYGPVERIKGIACAGSGWVHFDVAGGRASMMAFAPGENEKPRVVAIGRAVDEVGLAAAFAACSAPASG